jgi:SMI1 / KNR4 family (SUKH-1)
MPTPNKKEVIAGLVDELVTKLRRVSRLEPYEEVDPRPNPPASAREIEAYERRIGLKLPSSYRAFLELHNGYDWLALFGPFLSIGEVSPGGSYFQEIVDWKKSSTRYGLGEVLDGIVIAHLGGPNHWAYLDPNRRSQEDEMTVVNWDPSTPQEYPDLIEFLQQRIKLCGRVLAEFSDPGSPEAKL